MEFVIDIVIRNMGIVEVIILILIFINVINFNVYNVEIIYMVSGKIIL